MPIDDKIMQAAGMLRAAQRPVVLTGAGVSKESGVPTFRDALDGLWARFDPQELATPQAFRADPKLVWDWYAYRRDLVRLARPNPGHYALAALERYYGLLPVITQNVDDLHEQAGSTDVIHLHGRLMQSRCFFDCQGAPTLIDLAALSAWDHESGPPPCPHCGRWVRPDVVWFGEMLPPDALERAMNLSAGCDVMLVIGTAGAVAPATQMPAYAKHSGAPVIEINPAASHITPLADVWLAVPSGEALPQIVEVLADASES